MTRTATHRDTSPTFGAGQSPSTGSITSDDSVGGPVTTGSTVVLVVVVLVVVVVVLVVLVVVVGLDTVVVGAIVVLVVLVVVVVVRDVSTQSQIICRSSAVWSSGSFTPSQINTRSPNSKMSCKPAPRCRDTRMQPCEAGSSGTVLAPWIAIPWLT